jgi:phage baseplate assembly protein W
MATSEPEIWSDLHQNLVVDPQGNLKKVVNVDSVKTSIDNILRTYQGERVFLPQFASKLRNILFNPMNASLIDSLSYSVKEAIETWDDRVNVAGVDIYIDADYSSARITVRFTIKSYTEVISHTVALTP